nr:twin-arginine translocation signal domain-containing protein [Pyrinomonadaceae bacterium]
MKKELKNEKEIKSETISNVNRRKFLGNLGKTAVAAAAVGTIAPLADEKSFSVSAQRGGNAVMARANKCYQVRVSAAQSNLNAFSMYQLRESNGDELQYANRIGSYSKGLPHQANGEVVPTAYNALLSALQTGNPALFEQIPMGGDRKLTNPQSGLAFDMEGADCFSFIQKAPPAFSTKEIAAEIAENYWMA